ncbi:molybdopterin oxidoreductase family protein [soil metagenome]
MITGESQFIRGACPHDCPDTCAVITEVRDGTAISFRGDPDHPFTQGWLCAKVRPYLDRVYHPDRLTQPLRRVGPKGGGQWEPISWEAAVSEITSGWKAIIAEHGPVAILPYSYSGTLGLLQLAVCNERFWNRMGASGLERSICGAAAETAVQATLGGRHAPTAEDIIHSKLIIIWGNNPSSTNPHFVPFLRQAQRSGAKIIVIDPRRTLTARSADQHIQPGPASDGALALGMMHIIFSENLHDEAWLDANTVGWRELRERAADYPVERVAKITGLSTNVILALAREYATTRPSIVKFADGIQRHANGGQTSRALCCLPAIVGQIGVRGGGLYYSTSDYVRWDAETVGHASECPPVPRIVNMNRIGAALTGEVNDPPIESLFVFCANPVASSPNASLTIEGLKREGLFTVVHELFMTDTAQYADIVLPATSQLEQLDLHKPYGHRHLQFNNPAIEPLGESKSNWEVMQLLAEGMGYDEPWLRQSGEEVLDEIIEASRQSCPALDGITLERLKSEGTVPIAFPNGPQQVPYADLKFSTPSGKVELWCETLREMGMDPLPEYIEPPEFSNRLNNGELVLISGASHHYVSSSLANVPRLMAKEGAPFIEINTADAATLAIRDGQDVTVENRRGSCVLRAVVTDDVPPGVSVAPKGAWAKTSPDGRNVNWTTSDAIGDLAGQSTFHSNLVTIRPV